MRTAAPSGCGAPPATLEPARGGLPGTGVAELGGLGASGLATWRRGDFRPQAGYRASTQAERPTMRPAAAAVGVRDHAVELSP